MNFEYIELKDLSVSNSISKILHEDLLKNHGFFYISFCKYTQKDKKFISICSTDELKQEIKLRTRLKQSPVCRNNRLSTINQIITYKDLAISEPDEEMEIKHRQDNGYKSLLSINVSNEKIKYSLNLTSENNDFDCKNFYLMNQELLNIYFCILKSKFDQSKLLS